MIRVNKKIVTDIALNIVAILMPTAVLQLLVLPACTAGLGSAEYGLMTTFLALFNLIPGTFGIAINNIRLIYDEKYKQLGLCGDFNLLLVGLLAIAAVLTIMATAFFGVSSVVGLLVIIATAVLWLLREYITVEFRISLNYRYIFVSNALVAAGYILGYLVSALTDVWEFVFLFGQVLCWPYLVSRTKLMEEPLHKTPLLGTVTRETTLFSLAAFLSRGVSYSDRLILYPMLGGHVVSVYYVSSLAGKMLSMFVSPLSTVLLSYLAKSSKKSQKAFTTSLFTGSLACLIAFVAIALSAEPILSVLYPTLVNEAMPYVYITSGSSLIYALASLLNTHVLKFYSMTWQIKINLIIFVVYVLCSIGLFIPFGLYGFCFGSLLANCLKLVVTISIFFYKNADSKSVRG